LERMPYGKRYGTLMSDLVNRPNVRRTRGSLSRETVIDAALALADGEGLEALSMPTLAHHLRCGVMTIYGYVDNKEDLLDAIAQRGLQDLQLPHPLPTDAAEILQAWGRAIRLNLIGHPSLPLVFLSRAVIQPGIVRGVEALLGPLARAGMPPEEAVHAVYAVLTYATGFVAWEQPRTRRQPQTAYAAAWRREVAGLPAEDIPLVASIVDELPQVAGEAQFELGLTALVTGLSLSFHS
jgi:TetR/AcrR family transcriptional regulator, tetracycline repressor protein